MYANVKCKLPGPNSVKYMEQSAAFESGTASQQVPIVWESAEGVIVRDVDGNQFIDFTSGVLVTNVGHCHPRLISAVQKAAATLMNCYDFPTLERVELVKRLVGLVPDNIDRGYMVTTGSEAIDSALRVAKRYTGNFEIISFFGGFHGRTYGSMSVAGKTSTKKRFGPMIPGGIQVPYAYCLRCPFKMKKESCGFYCIDYMDKALDAQSAGYMAAMIVEPYQGASGFIFPPEGYLARLQEWAKSRDILFILDEVQSSFGRTGKMFALEWEKLKPDMICLGKGIGSGIPSAALLAESRLFKSLGPGEMSSTYGGNPVSCAAGLAVLDIIEEEGLCGNALKVGQYLMDRFVKIKEDCKVLADVRGRGLVIGLEFVADKETLEPSGKIAEQIADKACRKGLILGRVGSHGHVIRIAPPLVITMEQAEEAADILESVIKDEMQLLKNKG